VFDKDGLWRAGDGREGRFGFSNLASRALPPVPSRLQSTTATLESSHQFLPPAAHRTSNSAEIHRLVVMRDAARWRKDWGIADSIKWQLEAAGVSVDDKTGVWTSIDGLTGRIDGSGGNPNPNPYQ
jgi:hypothetical protein